MQITCIEYNQYSAEATHTSSSRDCCMRVKWARMGQHASEDVAPASCFRLESRAPASVCDPIALHTYESGELLYTNDCSASSRLPPARHILFLCSTVLSTRNLPPGVSRTSWKVLGTPPMAYVSKANSICSGTNAV